MTTTVSPSYLSDLISTLIAIFPILLGVFVGWVLSQISLKKPKLSVFFLKEKPVIRYQRVRIVIRNNGTVEAKNVVGKFHIFDKSGEIKQTEMLHWSRNVPYEGGSDKIARSYTPLTIFSKDQEELDLFILRSSSKSNDWCLYSYPFIESGQFSPPNIPGDLSKPIKAEVRIYCDGIQPVSLPMYVASDAAKLYYGLNPEELNEVDRVV